MQLHLLIVDDAPSMRFMLSSYFSKNFGYQVTTQVDGLAAWRWLKDSEECHLVIADIRMPEMDGIQLLEHIRGDELTASLPVIILTGHNEEAQQVRQLQLDQVEVMEKPFTPMELSLVAERLLKSRWLT